eukprot:COSAG03_NODE_57_length_15795_cov_83.762784_7_plen_964_part_00
MGDNASGLFSGPESNASTWRPGSALADHTIVPIWSFALFLLAYLLVSASIRRRYRWRRQMIEAVLREVEQKRSSGEEVHWPQSRPRTAGTDDAGSPVTPPKEPSDSPKKGTRKNKNDKKTRSPLPRSTFEVEGRSSPDELQDKLQDGSTSAQPRLPTVRRSTDELRDGSTGAQPGLSAAPRSTTFDVDDCLGQTADIGSPAEGSIALVRTIISQDMGPGAAPEHVEAAAEIRSAIETEREKEKGLSGFQRFVRHFSGNLEGLLLVQEFGVEAGFYLALLWMFARFFLCLSILGLPLAAFYYKYGDRQNADLSCFTAANLAKGSPETGMTAVVCCIGLVGAQGFCLYVWSRLRKLKYSTQEARKEALAGSTLMIDGLPNDITADDSLVDFLQLLVPGWIKAAHIALDLEKLIHVERRLAAARHEHSRAVESMGRCSGSARMRKAEKLVSALEREEEETRTTELKGTGIAFVTFTSLRRAMEFKRAISVNEIPQGVSDTGSPDSATAAEGTDQNSEASEAKRFRSLSPSKRAPVDPLSAVPEAEQFNLFGWHMEVAPDPSDILWENLRITSDARKRRRWSSAALLFSILLFGSALVLLGVFFLGFHYVNLVYNIEPAAHVSEGLSQVGDGLSEVFGSAYWLVFLAPPAVFLALITSVPMIAKKLIAIEKHFTRSAVMQSYVAKSFAFYLLLNLVLTSCSWVVIVTQSEEMDGRMSKMQMFADLSGTFHICVVLTEAFVMAPHRMYRGWNLHSGMKCVALRVPAFPTPALPFNPTLKTAELDDDAVLLFDFSKQYAEIFSIFAMLLAYGPLVPCVLPAGWLYFEILFATDQQVLRQQFAKHRTEDKRIRTITSHIQWSAVAAQVVPFVFIAVHGTEVGVVVLSLLALWTLVTYVAYIDHADNNGQLFYNKLVHCLPCVKTGRSSRAMSYTSSVGSVGLRSTHSEDSDGSATVRTVPKFGLCHWVSR